ncbi:MAG: hypothetical protein ACAI35_04590 [Candidatus Methylacidiphilales bacterium]|nr:hypothetical protein [Candidatus Methylacidiphilales bacterium]
MASLKAKVKKKTSPEEKASPVLEKQPSAKRPSRNRTVKVDVTAPAATDVVVTNKEEKVEKEEIANAENPAADTAPVVAPLKSKAKAKAQAEKVSKVSTRAKTKVKAAEETEGSEVVAEPAKVEVKVEVATPAESPETETAVSETVAESGEEAAVATKDGTDVKVEVISEPARAELREFSPEAPRAEPDKAEKEKPEKSDKSEPDKPEASPILTSETQEIFTRLREEVGFPVLAYWTSTTGSICQNDVMAMSHLLAETPKSDTVGLFLKSDGGNPEAALRLVHLLRSTFKRIILFAPFECASAATMVALGSNEVHMGRTSYLTAVDTSLKHQLSPVDHGNDLVSVSQDEVSRILRLWKDHKTKDNPYPEVYKYLHPLVIGALDRSSSLSIRICAELLSYHLDDKERSEQISRELNSSYPSHSYPITATEARRLGLNVKDLNPVVEKMLRDLNMQYSTMAHPLITDYDEGHYHINEICNILEINGRQIFYSVNKDWYYRKEERRWSPMKDKSSWKSVTKVENNWTPATFFIR